MTALGDRDREALEQLFAGLERDVGIRLEVGPSAVPVALLAAGGREIDTCAETAALMEALAAASDRIRLEVVERDEPGMYPSLTIGPGLGYVGLPWGYELAAVAHGIAAAGGADPGLTEESRELLAQLDRDVAIDVFVTPT